MVLKDEVLELEIPVDDPLAMTVPNTAQNLVQYILAHRLSIMVVGLLVEAVEELPAREALEDEVDLLAGLVDFLEADYVGVVELDEHLDLWVLCVWVCERAVGVGDVLRGRGGVGILCMRGKSSDAPFTVHYWQRGCMCWR